MRITHKLLYDSIRFNVSRNQEAVYRTNEQMITGRKLNRPSDDPVGAARALELRKNVERLEQFNRNQDQARSFLDATELALTSVKEDLVRIKELVVQQLGGIQSPETRAAAAAEIAEIREGILQQMNAKDGDRYIFSGYRTRTAPFDDAGNFLGIAGQVIEVEITEGEFIAMNMTGDPLFIEPGTGLSVVQMIDQIQVAVAAGDEATMSASIPRIDGVFSQMLNGITEVGARIGRLDTAENDNADMIVAATDLISEIEDVDYVEAATRYAEQERILQATLESSSRVMSLSILDFLG